MTIDRLKHSYAVALKMQEIGKNLKLTEEQIKELFILGFNHDIGYHFVKVYYHGEVDINYSSLYLDILNLADMQIDKSGNDVGFDKRLLDIESRYGNESTVYKKCNALVKTLKSFPRNFSMVFAFAGDSTITKFFAISFLFKNAKVYEIFNTKV